MAYQYTLKDCLELHTLQKSPDTGITNFTTMVKTKKTAAVAAWIPPKVLRAMNKSKGMSHLTITSDGETVKYYVNSELVL